MGGKGWCVVAPPTTGPPRARQGGHSKQRHARPCPRPTQPPHQQWPHTTLPLNLARLTARDTSSSPVAPTLPAKGSGGGAGLGGRGWGCPRPHPHSAGTTLTACGSQPWPQPRAHCPARTVLVDVEVHVQPPGGRQGQHSVQQGVSVLRARRPLVRGVPAVLGAADGGAQHAAVGGDRVGQRGGRRLVPEKREHGQGHALQLHLRSRWRAVRRGCARVASRARSGRAGWR